MFPLCFPVCISYIFHFYAWFIYLICRIDNGKAIRESNAADLPLMIDHFRYYAGVIRAEEGSATEIDSTTLSLCIQEPLGVVGQIIPWNFVSLLFVQPSI